MNEIACSGLLPVLNNWSVVTDRIFGSYYPPEFESLYKCLSGDVENHPRLGKKDGVVTSYIVFVDGNFVHTQNTTYVLGDPNPDYVKWCEEKGHHVPTKEVPIKWGEK